MDPQLKQIADLLRARYGIRLHQVLFFGSRARGDASPESDYDCILVFDQVTANLRADLDHFAAQLLMDRGMVLAWVAISEDDLERFRYEPFLRNARREGIAA